MGNNDGFKLKKNILWSMLSLIIAILTIVVVIKQSGNFSLSFMWQLIKNGDKKFFIMAILSMVLYIFAEGEALRCILNSLGEKVKKRKGFVYSAADIYFSAVTPSASGGQPASMYFMLKDGISVSKITLCLVLNLFMYNFSIVIVGIITFIFRFSIFNSYDKFSKLLIILGMCVLSTLVTLFFLLLKKANWVRKMGRILIGLLSRIHIIKKSEKYYKKLDGAIEKYAHMSDSLIKNKLLLLKIFLLNFFQRTIQIFISVFVFLGIGGAVGGAVDIWFVQSFSVIGSNCLPIPGAMGAIDYLMINGFGKFVNEDIATNMDLLSRGISFYTCIVVSFITIMIGYIALCLREKHKNKIKE